MFSQPERNIPTHPTHCQAQGEHRDWNSDHILVHRSLPSPKIPITNHSFVETKPSLNNSRLTQFLNINMENASTQRSEEVHRHYYCTDLAADRRHKHSRN